MKQIFKTLALAIVAIMTISVLSSCNKNNGGNGYRFEFTNVSFDTSEEYAREPELRFNLIKTELEALSIAAISDAQLISAADAVISRSNYIGINATITLKKAGATLKEWKIKAKSDIWYVVPADQD